MERVPTQFWYIWLTQKWQVMYPVEPLCDHITSGLMANYSLGSCMAKTRQGYCLLWGAKGAVGYHGRTLTLGRAQKGQHIQYRNPEGKHISHRKQNMYKCLVSGRFGINPGPIHAFLQSVSGKALVPVRPSFQALAWEVHSLSSSATAKLDFPTFSPSLQTWHLLGIVRQSWLSPQVLINPFLVSVGSEYPITPCYHYKGNIDILGALYRQPAP